MELTGEALELPGDAGLTLVTYTVEPNTASEQALNFLSSWTTHTPTANKSEREATDSSAETDMASRKETR